MSLAFYAQIHFVLEVELRLLLRLTSSARFVLVDVDLVAAGTNL